MRKLQVLGLLASVVAFAGCSSGSNGAAGATAAFDVTTVDPGTECPSGGERVKVGVDSNGNGTLDASEVSKTYLTCNGSSDGESAKNPLVVTEQEPPGKHCKNGGLAVETGNDGDGDGQLTGEELEKTEYVCAGVDGADGARGTEGPAGDNGADGKDGKTGSDGLSSLISTSAEPAGSHCVSGGTRVSGGVDQNANGVLDAAEVSNTAYVCNGGTSLVRTSFESPGLNCLHGGFRIDSGSDADFDGTLGDAEVKTSNYVCNGANGLNGGIDGLSSLVRTVAEPAGVHCGTGGVRIDMGIDDNKNTVLDASEVDSSSYVCTGVNGLNGSNGTDGLLSLVRMTAEPIGSHCAAGGVKVEAGGDDNHDTVLQASEVDNTSYVCNGLAGLNGLSNLLSTAVELPGANCSTGGFKVSSGVDTNANAVLDGSEITKNSYVCNGLGGLNGLTSLTKTALELPGANCATGGLKVSTGPDSNSNGVLDAAEATANNYICNGSTGVASLTNSVLEAPGAHCAAGGFKVNTGADSNLNAVLDVGEITGTNYLCNGINGLTGAVGAAGAAGGNGLGSLVKSVLELPGANCALGGVKVSSGVDGNNNGVLDTGEITGNSYVCNGATGAVGSSGTAGANGLVKTTIEIAGSHCFLGGLKVDSGADTNKNGTLEPGEVTNTAYLCTLGS